MLPQAPGFLFQAWPVTGLLQAGTPTTAILASRRFRSPWRSEAPTGDMTFISHTAAEPAPEALTS